jgi:hypothetical protein
MPLTQSSEPAAVSENYAVQVAVQDCESPAEAERFAEPAEVENRSPIYR